MMETATGSAETIAKPARKGAGIKLLLWGLQSPVNVGMVLRVAESYRIVVGILGSASVLTDPGAMATVSDFACGALQRMGLASFHDETAVETWRGKGRLVATSIDAGAVPLPDFRFRPGDVVALGNEYDGLPAGVTERADCCLVIPMADVWTPKPPSVSPIDPQRVAPVARDGQPNLNVAVAGAIICYAAYLQALAGRSAD